MTMKALAEVPTTQLRICVTIALIVVVVLAWLVACLFMGRPAPGGLEAILVFLGALAGVDVAQYLAKRGTFKEAPPNGPDVEDAKAGATIDAPTPPAPSARVVVPKGAPQATARPSPRGEAGTGDDTTPAPRAPTPIPPEGP